MSTEKEDQMWPKEGDQPSFNDVEPNAKGVDASDNNGIEIGVGVPVLAPEFPLAGSSRQKVAEFFHSIRVRLSIRKAKPNTDHIQATHELSPEERSKFLAILEDRLGQKLDHYRRPKGVVFAEVKKALEANPSLMWSLAKMEEAGGEPDVIAVNRKAFVFADCFSEKRKHAPTVTYAQFLKMADEFGVRPMDMATFRKMSKIGMFSDGDYVKTWIQTPARIRESHEARCAGCYDAEIEHVVSLGFTYMLKGNLDIKRVSDRNRCDWRGVLRVPKVQRNSGNE